MRNDSRVVNLKIIFEPILSIFNFLFFNKTGRKIILYGICLVMFIVSFFIKFDEKHPLSSVILSITIIMGLLWAFRPIPLAITALIPVFLFPLLGVKFFMFFNFFFRNSKRC